MMKNIFLIIFVFVLTGCATVPYEQVIHEGDPSYVESVLSEEGLEETFYTEDYVSYQEEPAVVYEEVETVDDEPEFIVAENFYLKDICDIYNIDWEFDRLSQVVTLSKSGKTARILIGSATVNFDDQGKILLESPLVVHNDGVIEVPEDFSYKVVEVFNQGVPRRQGYMIQKVKRIIIDAGHGGKDSGALSPSGLQEKDVVLDISKRVGKMLRRQGLEIIYTRPKDEFISLQERTEIASRKAADLFVSIHANAAESRGAHGVEVFHLKPLNRDERLEQQRLDNQRNLLNQLNADANDMYVRNIVDDLLYTHKQAESYVLSREITRKLSRDIRARDRGAKSSRFFVLRNTLIPAVLVEVGFLSNPKEEKKLKSSAYRQRVAKSIAESIASYAKN